MKYPATPVGRVAFGHMVEPGENLGKKLEWMCALELSMKDSEPLLALLEQEIERGYKEHREWPKDKSKLNVPYKQATMKDEAGDRVPNPDALLWSFKRNVDLRTGNRNSPPQIISSQAELIRPEDRPDISSGTTGKVIFTPRAYSWAGQHGIKFGLIGFQIKELVTKSMIDVAPIEGGWVPEGSMSDLDLSVLAG